VTTDTSEHGLESIIVASLTGLPLSLVTATPEAAERQAAYGGAGYVLGDPKDYDREYCVDLAQLSAFIQATQPATAESLGLDQGKTVKL
jgi:type I restriction enzyme R subunit